MIHQETTTSDEVGTPIGTPEPSVFTVYRYFDKRGGLLYVGYTNARHARAHAHWRSSKWWPLVASATFRHYKSMRRALTAERTAIEREHPTYNRVYTGRGRGWTSWALEALEQWLEDHPDTSFLTPADLSEIVELQERVVHDLIIARDLPSIQLGGSARYVRVHFSCAERVVRGLTSERPA